MNFWWKLPIKIHFLPKTKMVRETPRSIFYMTDPRFNDPKIELWTKSKILRGSKKKWKISFEVQNGTFEVLWKDEITLKYIAVPSATILAWFSYIKYFFLMNFMDFWPFWPNIGFKSLTSIPEYGPPNWGGPIVRGAWYCWCWLEASPTCPSARRALWLLSCGLAARVAVNIWPQEPHTGDTEREGCTPYQRDLS